MGVAGEGSKGKKNKNILPESWESNIKGDIILFRVDDDGGSAPFTLDEHRKWVDKGMPDCDQEKDDDEDKCSEEDASSEDDEESSEDDEDEETLEEFTERMQELPVAELRKACRMLELNEKGSRLQILARLHAHAQENVESDEDEDEIEDEDDKNIKNVKMTPSKAPTPVKAKAGPKSLGPVKTAKAGPKSLGPVKTIAKARKK
jgi:hypothetical protein